MESNKINGGYGMPLIKCPMCEKEISPNAISCPNCGEPLLKNEKNPIEEKDELISKDNEIQKLSCEYALVLKSFYGNKVDLIKGVMDVNKMSLKDAKDLVEKVPSIIIKKSDMQDLEKIKESLELLGCCCEISDMNFIDESVNYEYVRKISNATPSFQTKEITPKSGFIIFAVLVAIMIFIGMSVGGSNNSSTPKEKTYSDIDFYVMSEFIVEDQLKAPKTAKFCGYSNASITRSGLDVVVTGYVDAENGFGALLRTQFIVTFEGGDIEKYSVIIN